ncbi:hypothetical protein C8R47DRAFT_1168160 [Mycena vitilis]|nr:hypothetical protein C8R47DRAFT_1168160 [Mycena vitilis]
MARDDIIDTIGLDRPLSSADYPEGWEYGHHPDDFKLLATPLKPEWLTFESSNPNQYPLFHRVSFKIGKGQYLPMSFVVHSGAPRSLYLSDKAFKILDKHKRIDLGFRMHLENGPSFQLSDTPRNRQPFNIIGMSLIAELGFSRGEGYTMWGHEMPYW